MQLCFISRDAGESSQDLWQDDQEPEAAPNSVWAPHTRPIKIIQHSMNMLNCHDSQLQSIDAKSNASRFEGKDKYGEIDSPGLRRSATSASINVKFKKPKKKGGAINDSNEHLKTG